jgi:prepilin-type processing-associated H-X9-DG protein
MSDLDHRFDDHSPLWQRLRWANVLVAILLAVLITGLVLPLFSKTRILSNRHKCMNNLRQIGVGVIALHDIQRRLPPMFGTFADKPGAVQDIGVYDATLWYHLLPHVEEQGIYIRTPPFFDLTKNAVTLFQDHGDRDENAAQQRVPVFLCPTDASGPGEGYMNLAGRDIGCKVAIVDLTAGTSQDITASAIPWGTSSYAANYLLFGTLPARLPDSAPDGTSKTIMFTEKYADCSFLSRGQRGGNLWAFPPFFPTDPNWRYNFAGEVGYLPSSDNPGGPYTSAMFQPQPITGLCDPTLPQSSHVGGINVCMADGSVRFVSSGISPSTWSAVMTPGPIEGISYPVKGKPERDVPGKDWEDWAEAARAAGVDVPGPVAKMRGRILSRDCGLAQG